jgi:hypothetical protein
MGPMAAFDPKRTLPFGTFSNPRGEFRKSKGPAGGLPGLTLGSPMRWVGWVQRRKRNLKQGQCRGHCPNDYQS